MLFIDQTIEKQYSGNWAYIGRNVINKHTLGEAIWNMKEGVFSGTGEKDRAL